MNRLGERMATRIEEQVRGHLAPDERIVALALAATDRPWRRFWYGLISPFVQALVERPRYIVVTDRRLLVLRPTVTGKVVETAVSEPLAGLAVRRFRRGPFRTLLVVASRDGREVLRVTFGPAWRTRAEAIRRAVERASEAR